ncbi:MAG: sn-glycerol-3-phosphate ABC transporter ATP-binding protein UgpC [Rhodothermia bacterium]|nr:MAG: sn-glycerol-3-phosphate ABC transporter ATP-binding protein UgpC [Rhodothermia bacterium]
MERLRLEGIRKVFDLEVVAVHGVNLVVQEGEFVVLVGPSGCGKSTTLRMIAGLESITDGSMYIDNELVNDVAPKDRDIAMVFQNYALYPHLSVYDNMAFGLKLRKLPAADINDRVKAAADILGISDILDRRPKALSGGQRQRVAVGRAIVRKPRIFLFDEPLSNLDAKLRVQMRTEISTLHHHLGATMIYVTHDQVEAMTMGDRIVVMRDGFVEQIDAPINIYNYPANRFVAGFIGSPAMNFIEGHIVQSDGLRFREIDGDLDLPLNGVNAASLADYENRSITLGVRPEDIYDVENVYTRGAVGEVDLTVDLVETMGSEILVHARTTSSPIVARLAPDARPKRESRFRFAVDLEKLHFFDTNTGSTISASPAQV